MLRPLFDTADMNYVTYSAKRSLKITTQDMQNANSGPVSSHLQRTYYILKPQATTEWRKSQGTNTSLTFLIRKTKLSAAKFLMWSLWWASRVLYRLQRHTIINYLKGNASIVLKNYVCSLHCHVLQTPRICPSREGKYLPQFHSFPPSKCKEQSCKDQMITPSLSCRLNTSNSSGSTQIQLQHQDFQQMHSAALSENKVDLIYQISTSAEPTSSLVHVNFPKIQFRGVTSICSSLVNISNGYRWLSTC